MVKKRQDDAELPASGALPEMPMLDGPLSSAVRESAQQIWQAGLGAFAKAQGEGGKVFESLVREGVSLHVRETAVQLVMETRGSAHADEVLAAVEDAGYVASVMR